MLAFQVAKLKNMTPRTQRRGKGKPSHNAHMPSYCLAQPEDTSRMAWNPGAFHSLFISVADVYPGLGRTLRSNTVA